MNSGGNYLDTHRSQEELAELAGLHRTYPSMLERGIRTPTLTIVIRLAEALRVRPEVLLLRTLAALQRRV
jgi:transcriptional regulator with XRE-family HTH domain